MTFFLNRKGDPMRTERDRGGSRVVRLLLALRHRCRDGSGGGDAGIALFAVITLMAIATSMIAVIAAVSISENRDSGKDRQRTLVVDAAEAGIDETYAKIQASGLTPPCGNSGMVKGSPDRSTYTVTITYYSAAVPGGGDCTVSNPTAALIRSTASTPGLSGRGPTIRRMESYVTLSQVRSGGLTDAIFANGTLSTSNRMTLTGNVGNDANVYSNTSFACSNNSSYAGLVASQGTISLDNSCSIAGDAWATLAVSASAGANGTIGGRVRSSSSSVTLNGPVTVTGAVEAAQGITWAGCSAQSKCYPNSNVPAPESKPFPIIRGDSATIAQWQDPAKGNYTNYVPFTNGSGTTGTDCSASGRNPNAPTQWLIRNAATLPAKTILYTTCTITLANTNTLSLNNDLAIFAYGGFTTSQQVGFDSTVAGTKRNLYWIVPYDAASRPCSSPGISTSQSFNTTNLVQLFLYSPCDILFANSNTDIGQIYGGSALQIQNQFNLQFRPLSVFGVDPSTLPVTSYSVNIAYKREF